MGTVVFGSLQRTLPLETYNIADTPTRMYLNVSLLTFVLAITVLPCRAQPQIMFPDEAESRLLSRSSPNPVSKPDGEDIDTDDDRSQRHFLFSRQRDSSRLHNAKRLQFEEFF